MQTTASPATHGLRRTPALLLGPYYPLAEPRAAGSMLWFGAETLPGVCRLRLTGRVITLDQRAVADAVVELWHADPAGRYRHPSAPQTEQVMPCFAGYGMVRTDGAGRFAFSTLVPGAYADAGSGVLRAPHLHIQISGRFDRLVTQLFLPGNETNADDRWFRSVEAPERLTPEHAAGDAPGLHLCWTAVLGRG